jgi:hypothetical protein
LSSLKLVLIAIAIESWSKRPNETVSRRPFEPELAPSPSQFVIRDEAWTP